MKTLVGRAVCEPTFVLLDLHFFARRGEFLSGLLQLAKDGYASAIHGQNRSDRQSAVRRDLVTVGFGNFLNQAVGAQESKLAADRRRTAAPLLQAERSIGSNGWIKQCLEVAIAQAPERELSTIDRLQ